MMQQLGTKVSGCGLEPPTQPSLFKVAGVARNMFSIISNVRNGDNIKRLKTNNHPEMVIGMAAQSLVRYSYSNSVETYETNIMGLGGFAQRSAHHS
jgi:CDP-glucose 4,6-dehydratase